MSKRKKVKQFSKELIKYGIVGVLNTSISFSAIYVMIALLRFYDLLANFLGYSLGFVSSFYFNRKWTFKGENGNIKKQGLGFVIVFIICYVIQFFWLLYVRTKQDLFKEISLVIKILTPQVVIDVIGNERFLRLTMPEILMQISGIVIFSTLNFCLNKFYTFKEKKEEKIEIKHV